MSLLLLKVKKVLFLLSGFTAITLPASLLTVYLSGHYNAVMTSVSSQDSERDFSQVPFDTYDATLACNEEAQKKFGSSLLRTSVDWHSTRFQEDRNLFMVVLSGDVGSLSQYETADIYCYINPRNYRVSYFKAYDQNSKDILSSYKFDFKDIMSFFN